MTLANLQGVQVLTCPDDGAFTRPMVSIDWGSFRESTGFDLGTARDVFKDASLELRALLGLVFVARDRRLVHLIQGMRWFNLCEFGHPSNKRGLTQWTLVLDWPSAGRRFTWFDLPNWLVCVLWQFRDAQGIPAESEPVFRAGRVERLAQELRDICGPERLSGASFERWAVLGSRECARIARRRPLHRREWVLRKVKNCFFLPSLLG